MNAALSHNGGVGISRGGSRLVGVLSRRVADKLNHLLCRLRGGHWYVLSHAEGHVRLRCPCGAATTGWPWLART
jgi:hypothetical protein